MSAFPDEGYVKFTQERRATPPLDEALWAPVEAARRVLFDAGLVGVYRGGDLDGIGFGNVSRKEVFSTVAPFVISGTRTGEHPALDGRHYVRVLSVDAPANAVVCEGPVDASSETMTHAAVYAQDHAVGCVLHVHHRGHWERLLGRVPTTRAEVPYGTPEMAAEVARLFAEEALGYHGFFAMAGHEEGLVAFGAEPADALDALRRQGVLPG
jgi:L-ribulose-5-phosphate 4-epimerase